jgi:hypothetical protein
MCNVIYQKIILISDDQIYLNKIFFFEKEINKLKK